MAVQVAFQGGGAKFCDLLAAAEALQSLSEEIQVTRVAGTSAGAIVACLFASGISIRETRLRIAQLGRKHLAEIVGNNSKWTIFWKLLNGRPLFSEPHFERFLGKIFTSNNVELKAFNQLTASEVVLTTSDIRNGNIVIYRSQTDGEKNFINCILDSCALPFIFRNGVTGTAMVDGGLCENLPVQMLLDKSEAMLGFSFKRRPTTITTARTYLAAIIDTMIGHSVNRAKALAGDINIYEIETDVGTLDFEHCMEILETDDNKHYRDLVKDCTRWLRERYASIEAVAQQQRALDEQKEQQAQLALQELRQKEMIQQNTQAELMKKINAVHEAQHRPSDVTITRATKVIIANGLLPKSDDRSKSPDDITDTLTLAPSEDLVRSLRLGSSGKFGATASLADWRVLDKAKKRVQAVPIPIQISGVVANSKSDMFVIFFFGRGLSSEDGPYEFVRHSRQQHSLNGLERSEYEYVVTTSTQASVIERYEVIVYLPERYSKAVLHDYFQTHYPSHPDVPIPSRGGRRMDQVELDAHPVVAGFVAKGWLFEKLAPGETVGILIDPVKTNN